MRDTMELVEWQDPAGSPPLGGLLRQIPNVVSLWLLQLSTTYPSSLPANTFVGHLPGGSAVIIQGSDVSHTVILGAGGVIEAPL